MLLRVTARDPWAAIDESLERVERLVARISVGTRSQLQVHQHAWIRGESKPFHLRRNRRGVEIHALDRENSLYIQTAANGIDAALELISGSIVARQGQQSLAVGQRLKLSCSAPAMAATAA